MVDQPKKQDQIDMVLQNLQPNFSRDLVGIPFQDLRSLVQLVFSVEQAIAQGLWIDIAHSPNNKRKKPVGSSSRSGEVSSISYQHQRPSHHSPYRLPIVKAHFSHSQYHYQLVYVQQPYIARTSLQPRPPHLKATAPPLLRPYAQKLARQFTSLGMTLVKAFEKLRDVGLIVHLSPHPLSHPIPPHFHLHEHCLYHQIQGHDTERCVVLHHVIQDLIDSGMINFSRPIVTINPLPTHSTHVVPPPPSLQQIDLNVDGTDGHMVF